jgi:ABC-type sugar transport system substrate-binding protein
VLYATDAQYWQLIKRGMEDAARDLNADITIGLNQRQLATEAQVVEDMVTRGTKAIIISILDQNASAAVLKEAKAQGIVIVEDGTHLADKSVANYSVGVDQKALAKAVTDKMHDYIRDQLGGKAKIGFVFLPPQNPQANDRNGTALEAVKDLDVTIVAQVMGNTPATGATAVEQILQRDPDTQIIYAANAGGLEGAAAAVQRSGSKAKIFGLDMSVMLGKALLDPNSALMAVSDQDPYRTGYLAAEAGIKGARKTMTGPRDIALPVKLYTHETTALTQAYIDLANSLPPLGK